MALTLNNPAQLDITIYRGLDLTPIIVTVTDSNGNPVNLAGPPPWQISSGARKFSGFAFISNPLAGQITIGANRQVTEGWPVGETPYDVTLLSNGGVAMGLIVFGIMTIKESLAPVFP